MPVHEGVIGGIGLISSSGSNRRPTTTTEFTSLTSKVPYAIWIGNNVTGSIVDRTRNGNNLTAIGDPTYNFVNQNRHGVYYNSYSGVAHRADVGNVEGSGSFVYGAAILFVSSSNDLQTLVGRSTTSADPCVLSYLFTNTSPRFPNLLIRDIGPNSLQVPLNNAIDWLNLYPGEWLVQIQIDRETVPPVARMRISAGGTVADEKSGSMTGIGSVSGSIGSFGFGASVGNITHGGTAFYYGYYLTGSQCCGPNVLSELAASLGYER